MIFEYPTIYTNVLLDGMTITGVMTVFNIIIITILQRMSIVLSLDSTPSDLNGFVVGQVYNLVGARLMIISQNDT